MIPLLLLLAAPDLTKQPVVEPPPRWAPPVPLTAATPSGIRTFVLARRALPMVHVEVVVLAGSALDPPDRPGLAAAVATMCFEGGAGSLAAKPLAEAVEDLGAELDTSVSLDAVQLSLAVPTALYPKALALLADITSRPRFGADDWERTRGKRLAEIARRRDTPETLASDLFAQLLLGAHPYGHSGLGTPASITATTLEDLKRFHAASWGPRTTSVVVVGDVDPRAVPVEVEKAFAGWASKAPPPPAPPPPKTAPARFVLVDRPGAVQSELRAGYLGPPRVTPDHPALLVLSAVLGGSFTSRLNLNLREKHGYTYGAFASFELPRVAGPFSARAAVQAEVTAAALSEMVAELDGIRAGLSEGEVKKGKALVLSGLVDQLGAGSHAAQLLAELPIYDLAPDVWAKLPAALEAVDARTAGEVAKRIHLPREEMTILVVGDRKKIEASLRALPFGAKLELLAP